VIFNATVLDGCVATIDGITVVAWEIARFDEDDVETASTELSTGTAD